MDYEKCYLFEAEQGPPLKRRRTEAKGLHKSWSARHKLFQQHWASLSSAFVQAVETTNATTATGIDDFIHTAHKDDNKVRLPTGIILLEPGSSSRYRFRDTIIQQDDGQRTQIIALESGAATNLKTALKSLNDAALRAAEAPLPFEAIEELEVDEETQEVSTSKSYRKPNGRRLLAYDLQILEEYVRHENIASAVVHLEDIEGFSTEVLSSLIQQLSHWRDRIPLSLLMNVSTSVEILERRLSRNARKLLQAKLFRPSTSQQEFESLVEALMTGDQPLVLGSSIMRLTAQRQADYLQDIACIKSAWKYALMTAYFANPLTLFLGDDPRSDIPHDHCEALRTVNSFKQCIRDMLDTGNVSQAKQLLKDDQHLIRFVWQSLRDSQKSIEKLFSALKIVQAVQRYTPSIKESPIAALYSQGLSGSLRGSAALRGMFLAMRKAPGENVVAIVDTITSMPSYSDWVAEQESNLHLLRTGATDRTHSEIVTELSKTLEQSLENSLINVKDLPFHEVFLWDQSSPYREVFMPKPRQAIERALSTAYDYLDCDCCGPETGFEATNNATPRASVLYNLYKESGSLINVHDAWQAFRAMTGDEENEAQAMAQFQRSMAALKHLGMVKNTRKRVDHIAKVTWPDL